MTARSTLGGDAWDRVAAVFADALALSPDARESFIARALADEPALCAEVAALLEHAEATATPLEQRLTLPEIATSLAPGTPVGRYRLGRLAGRGGMAEVYQASRDDGTFQQDVAIKVLGGAWFAASHVARFQSERQIQANLDHPSIVTVFDGGALNDGRPWLAMPFVEGDAITAWCDAHAATLEQRLELFLRVADAVHFAHSRLVVHRDIKPSNILVSADGAVHLLDFGIARVLAEGEEAGDTAVRTAMRFHTPGYAAPEQVRGERVGTAADIYSLGVLLFELTAGTRPFVDGPTTGDLERRVLEESPPLPSRTAQQPWAPRLRGDLDRIILLALRKEPERRYGSAAQLAADVRRYLAGLPVEATGNSLGYITRKFVARHRGAVAVAAGALALLVTTAAVALVQWRSAAVERDNATREAVTTEAVVSVLTSLFERSNPTIHPGGDSLRVAALVQDGERAVDLLGAQPAVQARLRRVIADLYFTRGQYARGRDVLQRSYSQLMGAAGSESLEVARTAHALAIVAARHEGSAASIGALDAAVQRLLRVAGDSTTEVRLGLRELGVLQPDAAAGRALLQGLVASLATASSADTMEYAGALNSLASRQFADGELSNASVLYQEVLRLLDTQVSPDHTNRLVVASNLSATLGALGRYVQAEGLAREVVEQRRRVTPPDSVKLATSLKNLGSALAYRGFHDEAEEVTQEALSLERGALSPEHPALLLTWRNLGQIAAARGQPLLAVARFDSALAHRPDGAPGTSIVRALRAVQRLSTADAVEGARELQRLAPTLRRETAGNALQSADVEFWAGIGSLVRGAADSARLQFERSHAVLSAALPQGHARIAGAACGLALATAPADRAGPALPAVCERYRQWGMHLGVLTMPHVGVRDPVRAVDRGNSR